MNILHAGIIKKSENILKKLISSLLIYAFFKAKLFVLAFPCSVLILVSFS